MMGGGNAKMMREMQSQLAKLQKMQEELAAATYEASAGGGAVKVVIDGQQHLQSVTIDPGAVDPDDVEMLQDMIVAAVNEAVTKSQETAARQLGALTGNMKIPGLF
jgi:DNA-binding YbaB/EbfC family protein